MGSTFRYISDGAMFPCGGEECHQCGRSDVPIYDYRGEIIDPDLAADPELAAREPEIYELCADCITGGNVRRWIRDVESTIARYAEDRESAIAAYHRTPQIPLFLQGGDWPMCCGEWCEFVGCPTDRGQTAEIPSTHTRWERGPIGWSKAFGLAPECLTEVSLFRCVNCAKDYFTWQST